LCALTDRASRYRSEVVKFRTAQQLDQLGDRARRLGFVTGKEAGRGADEGNKDFRDTGVCT
jgi:hypothetical protein